jgi:hypothetical protein
MDEESDGKITERENKLRNEKEVVSRKCGKRKKATAKKNKRKTTEKEANGAVSLCG